MIGKTLSHYRIVEKIGAGGMGEVYRAHDERLERDVALKVLPVGILADESARRRFRREALALSKLNHPNIETVHDFHNDKGVDYLVMEYIPGVTLSDKLADGPLPEKEIVRLGVQIADGLAAAHQEGLVHRDIKPGNLRITPDGRLKILDFGLAKLVGRQGAEAATVDSITEKHFVAGTLPYMAPEQLLGEPLDGRTDIYAFGVVLFEMTTGRRPFQQTLSTALSDAIIHKPPPSPAELRPDASPRLQEIILKCMEKDPENRYQVAKDIGVDLRRLKEPSSVQTVQPAPPPPRMLDSVVALPSKVFASAEDSFLTDAIPNTISTYLAQVEGLEIKMPPTSGELERVGSDLEELADLFRVKGFVLSAVTAQADRLILALQLVEARSRRMLWSYEYEGLRANYIGLVREAAEGLRGALRPGAAPVKTATGIAATSEAELFYQRGLYYSDRYSHLRQSMDFDLAISALKRALELDPSFADAAGKISQLYVTQIQAGYPLEQVLPEIESWARRALELNPRTGTAWGAFCDAEMHRPRSSARKVVEYSLRAATLSPNDYLTQNQLNMTFLHGKSVVLSAEAALEVSRRNPLWHYPRLNGAVYLWALGRVEEALDLVEEVLRFEPDMPHALWEKPLFLLDLGRTAEAAELLKRLEALAAEHRVADLWVLLLRHGLALAQGNAEVAQLTLQPLLQILHSPQMPHHYRLNVGGVTLHSLARCRQYESVLDILSPPQETNLVFPYDWLLLGPHFSPMHSEPRFQQALARSRAGFEETLSIINEARTRGEFPSFLGKPLADLLARLGMAPSSAAPA